MGVKVLLNRMFMIGKIKFIELFTRINSSRISFLNFKSFLKNLRAGIDFYSTDKMKIFFMVSFYRYGLKLK